MAAIVTCPGCRKRLKIGTDRPGGKLRCPSCNTPFVLGSRTNVGVAGTPEFQAFELFEENVITDTFEIEEEPAPSRPKALPKSQIRKPAAPPPAPKPAPSPPRQPALEPVAEDDLDLLSEGPPKPRPPAPPPPPEPAEPGVFPEQFDLIDDDPQPASRPAPKPKLPASKPAPKPVIPAHSEKAAPPPPAPVVPRPAPIDDFDLEPIAERKSSARHEPVAPPKPAFEPPPIRIPSPPPPPPVRVAAPPPPPPPEPPAKKQEFFLPADFDPFATAPPPKPIVPDLSIEDETPKLKDEPDPHRIEHDFDIIESPPRRAGDGVAVVGGVSAAEEREIEASMQDFEEVHDLDIADRSPRREQRQTKARKSRVTSDTRGRWNIVFWGVTVQLAALAILCIAIVLGMFSVFLMLVARAAVGPGLLFLLACALFAFRELLVMLGYGLSIPAPAKNMAWLWAVLALAFAFASMFGYIIAIIFPPAFFIMPLTIISWFFYLIYIKSISESLKVSYLADEAMNLMKLLGIQLMGTMAVWGGMVGIVFIVRPNSAADLVGLGLIFAVCSGFFAIASLIMGAVIIYKYYFILLNLRLELGWRLES